jgi:hypothetical protein
VLTGNAEENISKAATKIKTSSIYHMEKKPCGTDR